MSNSNEIPELEMLLERLDRMETRMSALEAQPRPTAAPEPGLLAGLDQRMERQAQEIETLQVQGREIRQRVADEITLIDRRFAEVVREITREVPGILEGMINVHVEDLRAKMQADAKASMEATLRTFEQTVDGKVAGRMAGLEKALMEQSGIVAALSQRAIDSDTNLQRLVAAMERLCERTDLRPAAPVRASSMFDLPVEKKLNEAAARQPDPGFRPRIVKEDDESLKPRHRMSRL